MSARLESGGFRAVPVAEGVYWVGAIDWALRDFHGYATARGTTYNAYLLTGPRPTLIDTVKAPFIEEMMARIASVTDPAAIDVIVSNHAEMDHSGALPATIERVRPGTVLTSPLGVAALGDNLHLGATLTPVKNGESVEVGGRTLRFFETKMLHWPESMVTYLDDAAVLFSQDAFGMHLASSERFDDELPWELLESEAAKYFANILLLYSPRILKVLDALPTLGISPAMVAPDHGPVWRSHFDRIAGLYRRWATQAPTDRAVIVYDTMWGSTATMGRAIADGVAEAGATPRVLPLSGSHRSDVATELLEAGALVVGSPTINNQMFPTVADVLCYLRGLRPAGRIGAAFGSYGWGGEAPRLIDETLSAMKVQRVAEPLRVKYVPDEPALEQCRSLGILVGRTLRERVGRG